MQSDEKIQKLLMGVEQSPVSIVITNTKGEIEYVNPWFSEVTGYSREEVIGQNPRILKSGFTPHNEYVTIWEQIASGENGKEFFTIKRKMENYTGNPQTSHQFRMREEKLHIT